MPITASDIQQQIVREVGDTESGLIAGIVVGEWEQNADKALIHQRLQRLYTKLACLDALIGYYSGLVTTTIGDMQQNLSDIAKSKLALREMVMAEIERWEKQAQGRAGALVGQRVTKAPVVPPPGSVDANDPRFMGWPYRGGL